MQDGRVLAMRTFALDAGGGLLWSQRSPWHTSIERARSGRSGLHAVTLNPSARPAHPDLALAHVVCSGRMAFEGRALRAEEMEIIRLYILPQNASVVQALRRRYAVPVRVRPLAAERRVMLFGAGTLVIERLKDGLLHGRREERWADGTTIVAHYQAGLLHGKFTACYASGLRFQGDFQRGKLVARAMTAPRRTSARHALLIYIDGAGKTQFVDEDKFPNRARGD